MTIRAGQIIRAADLAPTEWQPVSFQNGWANLGLEYYDAQFRYLPLTNQVELRGAVYSPGGSNKADGTTIFTLPEGYRPSARASQPVASLSAPGAADNPTLRIRTNGEAQIYGVSGTANGAVAIDGMMFVVSG